MLKIRSSHGLLNKDTGDENDLKVDHSSKYCPE
jgi:hypothetical protein